MNGPNNTSAAIAITLAVFTIFVWHQVLFAAPSKDPRLIFFDVEQGDATLVVFPGGVKVITDAGPDRSIVSAMQKVKTGKYIDLAIISHPQLDHFNGFNYLLDNYNFGAFIWNGRGAGSDEWQALMNKISAKKIPLITLGAGDTIHHNGNTVKILSPDNILVQSAEMNDTSFVELVEMPSLSALLTGDIGFSAENYIISKNYPIAVDVLKVAHHGSKYSSSEKFLTTVSPMVAIIEVGKNGYGHPSQEAMSRLESAGAKIFETGKNGTIEMVIQEGKLLVFSER